MAVVSSLMAHTVIDMGNLPADNKAYFLFLDALYVSADFFRPCQRLPLGMVVIGLVGWSLNALARIFERRMQRLYGIDPR